MEDLKNKSEDENHTLLALRQQQLEASNMITSLNLQLDRKERTVLEYEQKVLNLQEKLLRSKDNMDDMMNQKKEILERMGKNKADNSKLEI